MCNYVDRRPDRDICAALPHSLENPEARIDFNPQDSFCGRGNSKQIDLIAMLAWASVSHNLL